MAKQGTSRLTKAILETADGLHHAGIMDDAAHAKITLRHLSKPTGSSKPMSGDEIREVRETARLS
jgi:DNA-binding transcriptional regulator YiaG